MAQGVYSTVPIHEGSLGFRGLSPTEARIRLLAAAESFLGVPYRWGGVDRRGMDCSGFVYVSFRDALHYSIPRTSQAMYNWAQRIPTANLQPGDMVFFVTVGTRVSHVGIYVGGGRFIHSASDGPRTGVIISHLSESFWQRTFRGAGRALPWDGAAARDANAAPPGGGIAQPPRNAPLGLPAAIGEPAAVAQPPLRWEDPGFFVGFGAAWSWMGGGEGVPSAFRGVSATAAAGYKWTNYRIGLELRPHWDNSLGVFRLPLALSFGTDRFQVFAGPAYIFGEPGFDLSGGERRYNGGWGWLWEAGVSAAFSPLKIGPGGLSIYGELAWQSYQRAERHNFRFRPDFAANLRVSTGLRYLWRL
ncbi:MAG: C40 family peptidase [Treponema sp.]|nr:C40 family peptidase [Treponema sp.]